MEHQIKYSPRGNFIESPQAFKDLLLLRGFNKEQEVFSVVFLDNRHNLLAIEDLFFGTVDSASVYPREVLKAALKHNAAAVALCHNHPSGVAEPSRADIEITAKLKKVLAYVDIRVLDHFIVGAGYIVSLAERGDM